MSTRKPFVTLETYYYATGAGSRQGWQVVTELGVEARSSAPGSHHIRETARRAAEGRDLGHYTDKTTIYARQVRV